MSIALEKLAKRLNLIDENQCPEPYVLTKEEEDTVLEHEKNLAKGHLHWKMRQLAYSKDEIDHKISIINWDEKIDRDEILQRANSIKNHELWVKEKRKKDQEEEDKKIEELKEHWTAKRVYNLMAWASQNEFGKKLIVNDDNKKLISALCFLISNDKRYETELDFTFKKGLLIRGVSGIGKTHLVRCLEKNSIKPVLTLSMIEISDELRAYGEYDINRVSEKIIYLDDVGTEESPVMHYGTKLYFFKNFIESIYLKNKDGGFGGLIMSTNLSFQNISEKYGFRVASRMRDMFNVIDVTGKDMRSNG